MRATQVMLLDFIRLKAVMESYNRGAGEVLFRAEQISSGWPAFAGHDIF
jgi:hypothetical protein